MLKRNFQTSRKYLSGVSLIELLIAIAIGLVITGVISFVFVDSSRAFRELRKSGEQIENGRYALSIIADDLRHAGFFGQLGSFQAPTLVDPCVAPTLAHLPSSLRVYSNKLDEKTNLPSCLPAAEVAVGSDIIVIRRAATVPLVSDAVPSAIPASGAHYIQANATQAEFQTGGTAEVDLTKKADGSTATILRKDGNAAPIRRYLVHIYYVSPCSQDSCAGGGDGIPTLKRRELATGAPTWNIVPLVSGIEYMQVDIGLDTLPDTLSTATGLIGDGAADGAFVETTADWHNVVSARVSLLARALEPTIGYTDSKTYLLSPALETAGGEGEVTGSGSFKRKVFSAEIRLTNPSSRRERTVGDSAP